MKAIYELLLLIAFISMGVYAVHNWGNPAKDRAFRNVIVFGVLAIAAKPAKD